jgi:hypothetical protein
VKLQACYGILSKIYWLSIALYVRLLFFCCWFFCLLKSYLGCKENSNSVRFTLPETPKKSSVLEWCGCLMRFCIERQTSAVNVVTYMLNFEFSLARAILEDFVQCVLGEICFLFSTTYICLWVYVCLCKLLILLPKCWCGSVGSKKGYW